MNDDTTIAIWARADIITTSSLTIIPFTPGGPGGPCCPGYPWKQIGKIDILIFFIPTTLHSHQEAKWQENSLHIQWAWAWDPTSINIIVVCNSRMILTGGPSAPLAPAVPVGPGGPCRNKNTSHVRMSDLDAVLPSITLIKAVGIQSYIKSSILVDNIDVPACYTQF